MKEIAIAPVGIRMTLGSRHVAAIFVSILEVTYLAQVCMAAASPCLQAMRMPGGYLKDSVKNAVYYAYTEGDSKEETDVCIDGGDLWLKGCRSGNHPKMGEDYTGPAGVRYSEGPGKARLVCFLGVYCSEVRHSKDCEGGKGRGGVQQYRDELFSVAFLEALRHKSKVRLRLLKVKSWNIIYNRLHEFGNQNTVYLSAL